ncbi:TPA: DUF1549 domain-containing protein [Candidatus Poribacteria bacterium]|nr:DUF1549 domain-containing protein [Candidatus Poribacteria bacterium]HIO48407.1 DUF1549 domain-containing protein [Candidatus Poribacteria bacterium]
MILALYIPDAKADDQEPRFLNDIAPILDKKGCSAALCHGKFGGQGGLDLSRLTLNPEADYYPIVYGYRGRRINLVDPERSLFLLKPTEQVSHEGGMRFEVNSQEYITILRWIENGAKFAEDDPRLERITVQPSEFILKKVGEQQQIKVLAHFNDNTVEDVTEKTIFESKDQPIAKVSVDGLTTAKRWGSTAVIARFLGVVSASFLTIPRMGEINPALHMPEGNIIDKYVSKKLKKLNIIPSRLCNDNTFIRRVFLDTVGMLPSTNQVESFITNNSLDKRSHLINQLLESPEFEHNRTLQVSDMLRVHPRQLGNGSFGERAATIFHEWIRKHINRPYNQFVKDLITAKGSTYQVGPANFYRIEGSPDGRAETIAQVFLGIRLSCARCHKHPFDRWTTDDYWNFAAFTGKVGSRNGELYQEQIIYYNPTGRVVNQSVEGNRGRVTDPKFLGGDKIDSNFQIDHLQLLADWITSPTNPYFARATVNRIWSYYFGWGIIDPVDDMRETPPSAVEGLLEALAEQFIKDEFDTKSIIHLILNSRTYQLSAEPNETNNLDDRFFSRFYPRAIPAQVVLDVVNDVTETKEKFGRYPQGTRAVSTPLPYSSRFLDLFGRSEREFLANRKPKARTNTHTSITYD